MMKLSYIFILLLILNGKNTIACSCNPILDELSLSDYYEYEVISMVKVVEVFEVQDSVVGFTVNLTKVRVEIIEDFKKEFLYDTFVIKSDFGFETCSNLLEIGVTYILYSRDAKYVNLSYCNRLSKNESTYIDSFNEDLDFLKKMKSSKLRIPKMKYKNGQRMAKGKLKNNKPVGKWIYYFPNGGIWKKGSYVDGRKNGVWIEEEYKFGDNEYRDIEVGEYKDDERIGDWTELSLHREYGNIRDNKTVNPKKLGY